VPLLGRRATNPFNVNEDGLRPVQERILGFIVLILAHLDIYNDVLAAAAAAAMFYESPIDMLAVSAAGV